jgi:multisubunit Na+/H+ antiporter MnhF subunit
MESLKAGFFYFLVVLGAGFVLGFVRVVWLGPRLGTRVAELLEVPVMLVVIVVTAGWTVRRLRLPPSIPGRLRVGLIALGLMLVTELSVVLWRQGVTLAQYVANRDPVAGPIYVVMLVVFAVMPALVHRALPASPPGPTR